MTLEVQIQSLIFSFVYGLFFSFLLNLNYKYMFEAKLPLKVVTNIFFVLDHVFFYFILLRWINDGILHFYFFICLFLGFVLGEHKTRILRKIGKKNELTK